MKRWIPVLPLAALAACANSAQPPIAAPVVQETPRSKAPERAVSPNSRPVVSDRGIGGTGSPAEKLADRGIGGTGIVGVITGFGSVWVNGVEVQYNASSKVDVDGAAASTSALQIGQVVAIRAIGSQSSPMAQSISVRHELIGRIEAVALDTGILTVAGQPVAISSSTAGAEKFGLGEWVSASGLRRTDGVLVASRLDPAPEGQLAVHGQVLQQNGVTKVGNLVLPTDAAVAPGQYVTLTGTYMAGHGRVAAVQADALPANPGGYFGNNVAHLVVQGFVRITGSTVRLNGVEVHAEPGLRGTHEGLAVVSMERGPDGSFAAVGLHYTDDHAPPKRKTAGVSMPTQTAPAAAHVGAVIPPDAGPGSAAVPMATPLPAAPKPASTVRSTPMVLPLPAPTDESPPVSNLPPTPAPVVTTPTPTPVVVPTPTPGGTGYGSGGNPIIAQGGGLTIASNNKPTIPALSAHPTYVIPKTFIPIKSLPTGPQSITPLQSGSTASSPVAALNASATVKSAVRKVLPGTHRP